MALVPTVRFSELDEQIPLFQPGPYDDPRGPKHVEEKSIGCQARSGPDEEEHAQVEGMANVTIGPAGHETPRQRERSRAGVP